jgi:murein DD-endopeptidase MepM/ murein hydrolase activator NlpD
MRKVTYRIFIILALLSLIPWKEAKAQNATPSGPVYIVQEGDSLWDIAYRFHVTQDALANANGIVNANQITIGQHLIIPGLEGISGILNTQTVPYGETLHSLGLRYHISTQMLKRLNHITSPSELYAGYPLVVSQSETSALIGKRVSLTPGQSILELAVLNDTDTWALMAENDLEKSSFALPGEVLRSQGEEDPGPGALPHEITSINISGLSQGQTAEILLTGIEDLSFNGSLIDHSLNFFAYSDNRYVALQGVHAMAEPGIYPLTMQGRSADSLLFNYSQMVMINPGDFLYDRSLPVDPATLDPETNRTENDLWYNTSSVVTPDKLWDGLFSVPVDPVFADCYSSIFGSRRSYNGSEYIYFHTGLDYCGQVGNSIYAAAPGVVVFTGPLTVRGNATMIDHGRGVYTAYMHQSEILVNVGDRVEQGQLIGKVGNTGRVEGPHLHFEVIVGGVQVDPLEWLTQVFPSE